MLITNEYEKHLTKEMEGVLFEHVYVLKIFDKYWACTDYYTVKKGRVYLVNNGSFQPSGDTLERLKNDCHRKSNYDSSTEYKQQRVELTHAQLLKRLGLSDTPPAQ